MAGIKIVDLPALGRDLISTDLLELSLAGGTGSRKITGQEIMNASKLSVGNTPIINGAVGQVLFQGTGNVLGESANLFWDNTNVRLGVGTSSPSERFVIDGDGVNITGQTNLLFNSRATSASGYSSIIFKNTNTATTIAEIKATVGAGYTNNTLGFFSQGTERMRIFGATGNVGIGTTTDAGYKLDVNGTARVQSGFQANGIVAFGTSNGFYWDSTNQRLGIGTNTPQAFLHFNNATGEKIRMETSSSLSNFISFFKSGVRIGYFGKSGPTDDLTYFNETATGVMTFGTNSLERMRIDTSGNVGIGTSSPFGKFDVKDGEVFVTTSTNANLRSRLTYQGLYVSRINDGTYTEGIYSTTSAWLYNSRNSHSFFRDGTNLFTVGSALTSLGMNVNSNGNVLIGTTTDAGFKLDVNGTAIVRGILTIGDNVQGKISADNQYLNLYHNGGSQSILSFGFGSSIGASGYLRINQNAGDPAGTTSGTIHRYDFNSTITNSTGTAQWNFQSLRPNYNFTGTYSGTVRGFYYNPTLTSMTGVTHFAFHSTSGRVRFEGLPTSPTGLNAGDIYNDGGTLKIV